MTLKIQRNRAWLDHYVGKVGKYHLKVIKLK
jgi:hypothetical protein